MTRAYDPHHPPVEGRTPLDPPWPQQQAMRAAAHLEELETTETLQSMGYSQNQIAKAMKVDRRTIGRWLIEVRKNRMIENVASLPERLDESLQARQFLYKHAVAMLTDKSVSAMARATAIAEAHKLRDSIDNLTGVSASPQNSAAAMSELYNAFAAMAEISGQQQLFSQLLQQRLQGTKIGAMVLGALQNNMLYIDGFSSEETTQEEKDEEDEKEGDVTDIDPDDIPDDVEADSLQSTPETKGASD